MKYIKLFTLVVLFSCNEKKESASLIHAEMIDEVPQILTGTTSEYMQVSDSLGIACTVEKNGKMVVYDSLRTIKMFIEQWNRMYNNPTVLILKKSGDTIRYHGGDTIRVNDEDNSELTHFASLKKYL